MLVREPDTKLLAVNHHNIDLGYLKEVLKGNIEATGDLKYFLECEIIETYPNQCKLTLPDGSYSIDNKYPQLIVIGNDFALIISHPIATISNLSLFINFDKNTVIIECNYTF